MVPAAGLDDDAAVHGQLPMPLRARRRMAVTTLPAEIIAAASAASFWPADAIAEGAPATAACAGTRALLGYCTGVEGGK